MKTLKEPKNTYFKAKGLKTIWSWCQIHRFAIILWSQPWWISHMWFC